MASADTTEVVPTGSPGMELSRAGLAISALPLTTSVANVALVADDVTVATPVVKTGLVGTVMRLADCGAPVAGKVTVGVGGTMLLPASVRLRSEEHTSEL